MATINTDIKLLICLLLICMEMGMVVEP